MVQDETAAVGRRNKRSFFPRFSWLYQLFGGSIDSEMEKVEVAGTKAVEPSAVVPTVTESVDRLPQVNETIVSEKSHKKYRLISVLGSGGYGTVFEATDETRKLAVKTEKYSKSMLRIEASVLKVASQHRCSRIVEFIEYGYIKPAYCYLVMPLLGRDLSSLRNEQKDQHFLRQTVVRLGILSVQAIQELHEKCGYISRDIKPGNFAIGIGSNDRRVFLIDFGLARKFMDPNRNVIAPRKDVGWRGTTRYGSLQAHLKQDLSRKDDVESWFYMLVELTKGALPWRLKTDRNMVMAAKMAARTDARASFLEKCPKEYDEILTHIDVLTFVDAPNYDKITGLLEAIMKQHAYTWDQRYDWEDDLNSCSTVASSSGYEDERANMDNNTR